MNCFRVRVVAEYVLYYDIFASDRDRAFAMALDRARKDGVGDADDLNPNIVLARSVGEWEQSNENNQD